jgi:hypothetical protein
VFRVGAASFGARVQTVVNFGGHGTRGCLPVGLEALLDAAKLNNVKYWLQGKEFFQKGLLVPRTNFQYKVIEQRIQRLEESYPVCQGRKNMAVMVHETASMRGLHFIGDEDDLIRFWGELFFGFMDMRRLINIQQKAILWTAAVPKTLYIPYLDFDEKAFSSDELQVITEQRIMPAVNLIFDAISRAKGEPARWQMFFNQRQLSSGLFKFSFHVHFYDVGLENINTFKLLLNNMSELPRKVNWEQREGKWVFSEDLKPIVDTCVYGGRNQLFRGPFCGKEGDSEARLMPVLPMKPEGRPWTLLKEVVDLTSVGTYVLRSMIARSAGSVKRVDFVDSIPAHLAPLPEVRVDEGTLDDHRVLYDFLKPLLLGFVIPCWQAFRASDLATRLTASGATVPVSNLRFTKNEPHRANNSSTRFFSVEGDTYCMMDTNHYHSRSPHVIGIAIDMIHCTIQQTCFACERKFSEKFQFLHLNNEIRIEKVERSKFSGMMHFEAPRDGHQFLLDYFSDLFRYHNVTGRVWAYDEVSRTWKSEEAGLRVCGVLIYRVNRLFNSYLNVYKHIMIKSQIAAFSRQNRNVTQEQAELAVAKLYDDAREFMIKHSNILRFTGDQRRKLMDVLPHYTCHEHVPIFNPYPHLVPMQNLHCVNVFTMETEEIRPNHYFTGTLSAELLPPSSPDVQDIHAWFDEISAGCKEKATYLKMLAGYVMTMFTHDRKMYVLKGTGKNGKGLYKQFLLDILEGPSGGEPRAKIMKNNYWAKSHDSPEACTPDTLQMLHKSLLYTDDMDRTSIDASKLKRIIAAEKTGCRGLFVKSIQFDPTCKVIWTMNFFPDAPGNDSAFWDRFVCVWFPAKYTDNKSRVNPKLYIFAQNDVAYNTLLKKRDAFFTVAIRALHEHYRSFPYDAETQQPCVLSSLPLPKSIVEYIQEARATQLPLASFITEYTEKPRHPLDHVSVDKLFSNYILFLENANERKMRAETTRTSFIRLLSTALEINVDAEYVELKLVKTVVPLKEAEYHHVV